MKLQGLERIIRVQQSPLGLGDASVGTSPPPLQRRSRPNVGPSLTKRPSVIQTVSRQNLKEPLASLSDETRWTGCL